MTKPFFINQKMVGELSIIDGKGVFWKHIDESKHILKVMDAIGIDKDVLRSLPEKTEIIILGKEAKYRTWKESYLEKGKLMDFGYGKQIFLPRYFFEQKHI